MEVGIASLAIGLLAVPLLAWLMQARDSEMRARHEYLAILAAREEMYEARFLAGAGARLEDLAHGWQPLTGSLMARLAGVASEAAPPVRYHPEQRRVETRCDLAAGSGRLRRATIAARWVHPDTGSKRPARPAEFTLVFGLLTPP